jgi:hypothetical protein
LPLGDSPLDEDPLACQSSRSDLLADTPLAWDPTLGLDAEGARSGSNPDEGLANFLSSGSTGGGSEIGEKRRAWKFGADPSRHFRASSAATAVLGSSPPQPREAS